MATTKNNNSNTGNERYMAYVGSYTHGKCKGITILDVDNEAGRLTKRTEVPINNASYLAVSNSGKYLYSICDEGLAAFLILPNGNINLINQESINGMRGCHITIDREDKYLFVSGYHDGKATVVSIRPDGGIGKVTDEVFDRGLGSVGERNFRAKVKAKFDGLG